MRQNRCKGVFERENDGKMKYRIDPTDSESALPALFEISAGVPEDILQIEHCRAIGIQRRSHLRTRDATDTFLPDILGRVANNQKSSKGGSRYGFGNGSLEKARRAPAFLAGNG
jgi:hypothetical protein